MTCVNRDVIPRARVM